MNFAKSWDWTSFISAAEPKKSTKPKKGRAKAFLPEDKDYVATSFSCAHCNTQLQAREWNGKTLYQHRTEVKTESHGYILVKTSGTHSGVQCTMVVYNGVLHGYFTRHGFANWSMVCFVSWSSASLRTLHRRWQRTQRGWMEKSRNEDKTSPLQDAIATATTYVERAWFQGSVKRRQKDARLWKAIALPLSPLTEMERVIRDRGISQ